MYVITVDQRRSRAGADRVPELLDALANVATVAGFERTAGDEVQGLLDSPKTVRAAVLTVLRSGGWHCGVGLGEVDEGSWAEGTRSGRGSAYLAARTAVEAAKTDGPVAVRAPNNATTEARLLAADHEALWRLVAPLVERRTDAQWRVVEAVDAADTQSAAAESLGMRPASVTGALQRSGIREERGAYRLLDRTLAQAHDAALPDGAG